MVTVLLTGAGGQLGTDIVSLAASKADIDLIACTYPDFDITDPASVSYTHLTLPTTPYV